jgi:ElaB/YqjD/DUF883 family membrane-anchored ribosome-binding protein
LVEAPCFGSWGFRFPSFCCWPCFGITDLAGILSALLLTLTKEIVMDQSKVRASSDVAEKTAGAVASSMSRGKEAVTSAASDATAGAEDNLKALWSDLTDLKDTVAQFISRAGNETAKSAREIAGHVSATASDLAERGSNAALAATDQAKTMASEFEKLARGNPLGAMAGALVVGVVIGMMGRRS